MKFIFILIAIITYLLLKIIYYFNIYIIKIYIYLNYDYQMLIGMSKLLFTNNITQ